MGKFVCKICGKEFERVGNAIYCGGPHFRSCPVCGKPVQFHRLGDPVRCCSKQCAMELANKSKSAHGTRECALCGSIFTPRQANQKYCGKPHTFSCVVCGKQFTITTQSSKDIPKTCGNKECIDHLRSQTTNRLYGVDNISKLDSIRKKISSINSSEEVSSKRRQSCLEQYGYDNPAKSPEIRSKMSEICSSDEFLKKRESTVLSRYGVSSPMMLDSVKQKRRNTYFSLYGRDGFPYSDDRIAKMITDPEKANNYVEFRKDPKTYITTNYPDKPNISLLVDSLGVTASTIYYILSKHGCSDLLNHTYSRMENEVVDFLRTVSPELNIVQNTKNIIKPYELDIYLPEYNIAIECNPTYTHNSSKIDCYGAQPKSPSYHKMKSEMCEECGVFLFHIFGYEWLHKKPIIQSMLCNLLGKNSSIYGARETQVCIVSHKECQSFLNANHRQGYTQSKIRLGLRLKKTNELVSVMTFGHMRHTMGKHSESDDSDWELSRFCTKLNTTIVGGASKLFSHFLSEFNPKSVTSFSDIAHTRGSLYEKLGFVYVSTSRPNYVWADSYDFAYYTRVSCQKRFLKSLLNDETIDLENNTERGIMESHGFLRVYDCGVKRWVYG